MTLISEENKTRISEAVRSLIEPPLTLLQMDFLNQKIAEKKRAGKLEGELEVIRKRGLNAAIRLHMLLYRNAHIRHEFFEDVFTHLPEEDLNNG